VSSVGSVKRYRQPSPYASADQLALKSRANLPADTPVPHQ